MYAIVRAGGRQEKVSVGDLITVDRVSAKPGETLTLQTLLVVDGDKVTSDIKALNAITVTGEVVDHSRGPKIEILRYKNKTGYRRRQGHRSDLTDVQIISIGDVKIALADKITAVKDKPAVKKTPAKTPVVKATPAPVAQAPEDDAPVAPSEAKAPAAKAPAKKAAAKAPAAKAPAKKAAAKAPAAKAPAKKAAAKAPAKKAPAKKATPTAAKKAAPKKTEK